MASRSSIRQDLAARIEAVDITAHRQDPGDGWTHARLVDLTQPGDAWAHLSYAVVIGQTRIDERQRRADEHAITEVTILVWYAVREMTSDGGFADLDLLSDLQEAVARAIAIDDTSPAYAVRIDALSGATPVSTGPTTTVMCQFDITVHHSLSLG